MDNSFPENGRICSQVQEKVWKEFCTCLCNRPDLSANPGFRKAGVKIWILGSEPGEERGGTPMPTCTV